MHAECHHCSWLAASEKRIDVLVSAGTHAQDNPTHTVEVIDA